MIQEKIYRVPTPEHINSSANNIIKVTVPGSKSITNRALLLATLAKGESLLSGALFSEDATYFQKCIQDLGFDTKIDEAAKTVQVTGLGGEVPKKEASVYVGSAGTAARFLAAYLGISQGTYHMNSSEQMKKRPMAPLLTCLEELGCKIAFEEKEGFFPFTLRSGGFCKNAITINIDHSSQFLSALLIAGVLSEEDLHIRVEGSHGMSYIQMTCRMMEQFGVKVLQPSPTEFVIPAGQTYQAMDYAIEPDLSAACYFYAMCPLLQIPVLVNGVHEGSLQGDLAFVKAMTQLGCGYEDTPEGILLTPPATKEFPGVDIDMGAFSDQAITLSAIAPFASSPTTIRGISHIRLQESDRIHGIVTELKKAGIRCEETKDSITIFPGTPQGAAIDTYDDHRMAMGFSLLGLRTPGIVINDPGCCKKTFADYFETLEQVLQDITR